jgi:hypothetical protein
MLNDPRLVLERLCAERGEDFAGLSRMLGRNPAYIQQFVRRGVPKRLKEEERRKLARYFAVSESLLGGPPTSRRAESAAGQVKRIRCAPRPGPGAIVAEELGKPYFAFDERWLKALTATSRARASLSIVRVEGDSMAPTLNAGDDILVDLGDAAERLRDGIYVLAGRRRAGGQAARAPSGSAAGHGPVGQSGLSRLARLRARRDQLHRPGDLGRAADR